MHDGETQTDKSERYWLFYEEQQYSVLYMFIYLSPFIFLRFEMQSIVVLCIISSILLGNMCKLIVLCGTVFHWPTGFIFGPSKLLG